jgi:hypothetical protein
MEHKMKAIIVSLLLSLTLSGCIGSLGRSVARNRNNLTLIEYGMTKEQVHSVMGQKSSRAYSNPQRTAMRVDEKGNHVEIFYYWTDGSARNGIQDSELTPIVFQNGKVIGWGREFFMEFVEKHEIRYR